MNTLSLVVPHAPYHQQPIVMRAPTTRSAATRSPGCGHDNPPQAAFCGECGVSLISQSLSCATCGQPNPTALKFCRGCGTRQSATARRLLRAIAAAPLTMKDALPPLTSHGLDRLASEVFVGRAREMEALREHLEATCAGHGRTVLLTGEPGIGKTHTAMEFATYARVHGARVLRGRCHDEEGLPPYWLWIQVMRAYLAERPLAALRTELGAGAAEIAHVLSEVQARFPDLPPMSRPDDTQARFRFFDSFTQFVKNAAKHQPFVLILDDVQWADTPSLLLLQFLAREIGDSPVLILATCRDLPLVPHSPLAETVPLLAQTAGSQTLTLRGLSACEVARFIELTVGSAPSAAATTAMSQGTEGHPFFLTEVMRLLATEGKESLLTSETTFTLPLPQGARHAIICHVQRVSEPCRQMLTTAAVLGREFDLTVLARLHHAVPPSVLLTWIDEALAVHLIAPIAATPRRYSFSHALVREALYEALPLTRRVQLHHHVGLALEERYHDVPEAPLAELAYHFLIAVQGDGEVEKAVDYAKQAGDHALKLLAYEDAILQYERALDALGQHPAPGALSCELHLALADAQLKANNLPAAKETYQRAAELATRQHLPHHFAQAVLGIAGPWLVVTETNAATAALLAEALRLIGPEQKALRAELLARLAREVAFDTAERRADLSAEAVALAREANDPWTLAHVLRYHHLTVWGPHNLSERLAWATEIVHLAESIEDRELVMLGRTLRVADLLELGDIPGVDGEIIAYTKHAEAPRSAPNLWHWFPHIWGTLRALLDGRLLEVEPRLQQALELAPLAPHLQDALLNVSAQQLILRREEGRLDEMEALLTGAVEQYHTTPAVRCTLVYFFSELGRKEEAQREFQRWASDNFTTLPRDMLWLFSLTNLAAGCVFLKDTERAALLYALLLPHAEQNVMIAPTSAYADTVAHFLGMLATLLERWDEAEHHFACAIERNLRMGARPRLAHTRYSYARMLFTRNQDGDKDKAEALLSQALATAQELGMTGLEEKIQELRGKEWSEVEGQRSGLAEHAPQGAETIAAPMLPLQRVPPPQSPALNVLRKEGDYWTIAHQGTSFRLRHLRGLDYIAHLLRHPDVEFLALDVLAPAAHEPVSSSVSPRRGDPSAPSASLDGTEELLDSQARATYKHRLEELREELEEAQAFNDLGRVDKLQQEMDFLAAELARAVGLRGRARTTSTSTERARVNVAKGIRIALTKIAEQSPFLEHYLATTIKTGLFCSYTPSPVNPIAWDW